MNNMKKLLPLLLAIPLLASCGGQQTTVTTVGKYGVFLGLEGKDTDKLLKYEEVMIDIDNFTDDNIKKLKDNKVKIYTYISVGSLEKYRSYAADFDKYTFMDYDNWPDEKWIDVSVSAWQDKLLEIANAGISRGADGFFLDNFDVYYIAKDEYKESTPEFVENIYNGCHSILEKFSKLEKALVVNSGSDFLERMNDENDELIKSINVYAQETVFSSIIDYNKNIFSEQDPEDTQYFKEVMHMMHDNGAEILLIEYTTSDSLVTKIKSFVNRNGYYYYVSNNVDLK